MAVCTLFFIFLRGQQLPSCNLWGLPPAGNHACSQSSESHSYRPILIICERWRRRRDSNPRGPFEPNGFQDRRFQPLTHSSVFNSSVLCELAANLWHSRYRLLHFGAGCSWIVAVPGGFPDGPHLRIQICARVAHGHDYGVALATSRIVAGRFGAPGTCGGSDYARCDIGARKVRAEIAGVLKLRLARTGRVERCCLLSVPMPIDLDSGRT